MASSSAVLLFTILAVYCSYSLIEYSDAGGSKGKLYDVLGVDENASEKEIKQAYRKLSKELHPDKQKHASTGDGTTDVDPWLELVNAYETLSDPQSRRQYDSSPTGAGGSDYVKGGVTLAAMLFVVVTLFPSLIMASCAYGLRSYVDVCLGTVQSDFECNIDPELLPQLVLLAQGISSVVTLLVAMNVIQFTYRLSKWTLILFCALMSMSGEPVWVGISVVAGTVWSLKAYRDVALDVFLLQVVQLACGGLVVFLSLEPIRLVSEFGMGFTAIAHQLPIFCGGGTTICQDMVLVGIALFLCYLCAVRFALPPVVTGLFSLLFSSSSKAKADPSPAASAPAPNAAKKESKKRR